LTAANYTDFLQYNFGVAAPTIEKFYPLSAFNSTPLPAFYAIVYITTAVNFACPAYRGLMAAEKKGIPVYTYQFGHAPSCPWYASIPDSQQALSTLGSTHTAEIPFVFANTKDLPLPGGNCTFTSQEQEISAQLVAAWTSMAATANPSSSLLAWPAWNSTSSLGINVLNSTAAGVVNYTICELWDTIAAEQINGTLVSNTSTTNASSTTSGSGSSTGSATTTAATSTSTNAAGGFIVQSSILLMFLLVGIGALL
jgi:Carboxylesterase family